MLNPNLSLVPAQGVKGTGQAINNSINNLMGLYKFNEQKEHNNRLLDLNQEQMARENRIEDQALATQSEDRRRALQIQSSRLLYGAADTLSKVPQDQRRQQLAAMLPNFKGVVSDQALAALSDPNLDLSDTGINQFKQGLSPFIEPPSAQEALRKEELGIKKDRLEFDKEQAEKRLKSLNDSVDALDVPEEDKKVLKALPAATLEKLIQKQLDPKTKADKANREKEQLQAQQGAQEILDLATTLKSHPGRERASGFSSILPSAPGGDARDFEVKLERLSSLLTLDNLGLMSGVLTDKDIQILRSAAGGLDVGQSEEALLGELDRIIKNVSDSMEVGSADANKSSGEKYSVGQIIEHNGQRFRVTGGDLNDPDVELVE